MKLDIPTLLFVNFIVNIIGLGAMILIWRRYGQRFAGLSFWAIHMLFQVIGIGLDISPHFLPEWIMSVFSNTFILLGALMMLIGLERFTAIKSRHFYNIILLIGFVFLFSYFAFRSDLTMRSVSVSMMIIIIEAQMCWLLLIRVSPDKRNMTRLTGLIAVGYVFVSLVRIILLFIFPIETNDFFKTGPASMVAITAYLSLMIGLVIALVLMVTYRLLAEVQTEEQKFNKAFHSAPYAVIITRVFDGRIFEVNEGFSKITGYRREEVVGKSILDLRIWARQEDRGAVLQNLSKYNKLNDYEINVLTKSGKEVIGLLSADMIEINNEQCIISSVSDITEQSRIKEKLREMATHDVLTGLANRRLFYDRFELALANARREKNEMALISIDLDKFKLINDTYGHAMGDLVLVQSARRLVDCSRRVDTVARFGGDEFLILLWKIKTHAEAIKVAQRILENFRQPVTIENQPISLSVSIGISFYPEQGEDILTLIKKSDEAMYRAKEMGRDIYAM
ncbi:MAG: diguanylate cyclase [Anaerolineae bacterium]|nr:diguanylate cyclase [Anaerolineae bacterium]